jgi:hypothetical protein
MRPPIHLNSESASGEGREVLLGILFFPYSAARALSNTISVKVAVVDISRRRINSLGTCHLGLNGLDNRCATFGGVRTQQESNLVFYFVSPSKAVGVQTTDFGPANAAVNVVEK